MEYYTQTAFFRCQQILTSAKDSPECRHERLLLELRAHNTDITVYLYKS